ncbi:hypothetical protein ELY16_01480 [Legionella qingyii]|nr:hypothetical protein ELY16_01480 [Legionella qingyii]
MINKNGCIPYVEGSFVNIKYLLSIFCGLLSSSVIANQSSWSTSIAVGASRFTKSNDQTIIISDYITDSLVNSHQKTQATYSFSFQRNISVNSQLLKKILIGPAIYYQQARFTGDVYELNDPEFFNYTYKESGNIFNLVLQGDLYLFSPIERISPFITLGAGLSVSKVTYHDQALPGITPVSSLRLPAKINNQFAGAAGAGVAVHLNKKFDVFARYLYSQSDTAHSSLSNNHNLLEPIKLSLNNQAFYIGLSFNS